MSTEVEKPAHHARPRKGFRFQAKAAPSTDYPAGHFTQLMREANWPPRFESQLRIDPRTRRYATEFAILNRPRVGWEVNPLGLAGATSYDRPVPTMTR